MRVRFENDDAGAFAEVEPRAVAVEGFARLGAHHAERPEAGDRHAIELIRPAGDGDVAQARADPAGGGADRVRAAGARVDDRHPRAGDVEQLLHGGAQVGTEEVQNRIEIRKGVFSFSAPMTVRRIKRNAVQLARDGRAKAYADAQIIFKSIRYSPRRALRAPHASSIEACDSR